MSSPQQFRVPEVEFLAEQDGLPERELKGTLAAAFAALPMIERAYLVRVRYADSGSTAVALCLDCAGGEEENPMVLDVITRIFQPMFRTDEQLDVIFLTADQHAPIERVCEPFYEAN